MLRSNNLNGFGNPQQFTTLRQANFLVLPTASRVAIDGTGGFPDIGGNVGTIVNRGVTGGSLNATSNSNRGTLQSVGVGRLSVRGQSAIQMAQTFTALTGPTVYVISAFIPRTALNNERAIGLSLNSGTDDFSNASGGALLTRSGLTDTWGVFRDGASRGFVAATINVLTIFETIASTSETRICKDGGTDTVTAHGAIADFNASSFRFMCSHEAGGAYGGPCNADVLVAAVFFTNPSTDFRARALAEVRSIAGIATP
jgi:hypothetical protein